MPINKGSMDLGASVDSQGDKEVSLKAIANLGMNVNENTASAAKGGLFSGIANLFSGVEGRVGGLVRTAGKLALKAGVAVPMDNEIANINSKITALKSLTYQAREVLNKAVPRLLSKRTAQADAMAQKLTQDANAGIAAANVALPALSAAQWQAQDARRQILDGTLPARAVALYEGKKYLAEAKFNKARLLLTQVSQNWAALERSVSGQESLLQIAKGEAGGFASDIGHRLTSAGTSIEEGLKNAAPLIKYWPYAAAAFVGLYVLQFLPKPRRD